MTALIIFIGCNLISFAAGAIAMWFHAPVNTVVEYVEYDIRPAQVLKDNVFPIRRGF